MECFRKEKSWFEWITINNHGILNLKIFVACQRRVCGFILRIVYVCRSRKIKFSHNFFSGGPSCWQRLQVWVVLAEHESNSAFL